MARFVLTFWPRWVHCCYLQRAPLIMCLQLEYMGGSAEILQRIRNGRCEQGSLGLLGSRADRCRSSCYTGHGYYWA